ncbi:hypothetical protein DL95DRAFT_398391 [Leptodontidium sp. 2 PMI_412]|nr:hypothetical protein DL95DRAFT_398391 [Leptodontidium sp. 2 PMI_412]
MRTPGRRSLERDSGSSKESRRREQEITSALITASVREDSIEAYLQTSSTGDTAMGGQYRSHSKAVQVLEQLLSTRKAGRTDGNNPTGGGGQSFDRDSSGITTTQSVWDPSFYTQNPSGRYRSSIQHAGKAASMQYMTPSGSTTSSATSGTGSSHGMSHHQSLVPAQMGRNLSPASNASSQNHRIFEDDQPFSMSNRPYPPLQSNTPKHQYPSVQQSSIYVPTTSNMNDCNYAEEMITTMSGVSDSSAVRADLGCRPGIDCEVDNQLVFNVMDRYSGVGL